MKRLRLRTGNAGDIGRKQRQHDRYENITENREGLCFRRRCRCRRRLTLEATAHGESLGEVIRSNSAISGGRSSVTVLQMMS